MKIVMKGSFFLDPGPLICVMRRPGAFLFLQPFVVNTVFLGKFTCVEDFPALLRQFRILG